MPYYLKSEHEDVYYEVAKAFAADFSEPVTKPDGDVVIGTVDVTTGGVYIEHSKYYCLVEMRSVESSNIKAIGYNYPMRLLVTEFKTGAIYQYDNVPAPVFEDLMEAQSKGKYFHKYIRNTYSSTKVVAANETENR